MDNTVNTIRSNYCCYGTGVNGCCFSRYITMAASLHTTLESQRQAAEALITLTANAQIQRAQYRVPNQFIILYLSQSLKRDFDIVKSLFWAFSFSCR
ncbi:hypothetical protein QQF64_013664 [Cirrhinus molitorella]|uniref:Uncharacterized protein n=1 Tax=Cirrhinus molitorella TaxID=172907 RepID=A0ABR3LW04_9TELE